MTGIGTITAEEFYRQRDSRAEMMVRSTAYREASVRITLGNDATSFADQVAFLTVVNLTAALVERVVTCDNLFAVESVVGDLVVSNYRVTCPAENSIPLRIALGAFESVELTRLWTGAYVRYAAGGFETVALPPGSYRVYGALGELRSKPQLVDLTAR